MEKLFGVFSEQLRQKKHDHFKKRYWFVKLILGSVCYTLRAPLGIAVSSKSSQKITPFLSFWHSVSHFPLGSYGTLKHKEEHTWDSDKTKYSLKSGFQNRKKYPLILFLLDQNYFGTWFISVAFLGYQSDTDFIKIPIYYTHLLKNILDALQFYIPHPSYLTESVCQTATIKTKSTNLTHFQCYPNSLLVLHYLPLLDFACI